MPVKLFLFYNVTFAVKCNFFIIIFSKWTISFPHQIHATTEQSGMAMMMDMRKLANHPLLLRYHYQEDEVSSKHHTIRELSSSRLQV